jgi:uncharacterized protein YqeY
MSLQQRLDDDLTEALRQGEKLRLSALRMLRSEIKYAQIAKGEDLVEAEIMEILSRYARKRKDAAAEFERGGRQDLVEKELQEHAIVSAYLPQALSPAELEEIVEAVISETGADEMKRMGEVMKLALERSAGRAEGAALSAIVKARLSR